MGKHSKKIKGDKKDSQGDTANADEGKFMELLELENRTQQLFQQHAKIVQSLRNEEMKKRRTELIMQELLEFKKVSAQGRLFKGVGRSFFLSDEKEIQHELTGVIKKCDAEIPKFKAAQKEFETKMKQEQENMKNLESEMKKMRLS